MATGPGFPGPTGVYIPNWEASGRLAVGFSRNPKKFAVMKYCQLVESPKNTGYYMKLTTQEAARVVSLNDYRWSRGSQRPVRPDGLEAFNFIPFATERFDYGFNLDDDTVDQAEWDIGEQHGQIHAQKLMTARTIRVLTALTTTSNWNTTTEPDASTNHYATAASQAGGYLDQGTSTNPIMMNFLNSVANLITLDTLGVVESHQLCVLMNPHVAKLIAASPEIHDYLKGSPDAYRTILDGTSPNARFGLPESLYGFPIIVDQTVQVTSRKGDTLAKSFVMPDATVVVLARVGELEGVYGLPSFSTMTIFWYRDELTIERFPDPKNRLMEYHLVEDTAEAVTAPLSGFLCTSATSANS